MVFGIVGVMVAGNILIKMKKHTKEEILNALEDKKIVPIKISFKGRLELFILKWKVVRKFPDYSLKKELKDLFFQPKLEVLIK